MFLVENDYILDFLYYWPVIVLVSYFFSLYFIFLVFDSYIISVTFSPPIFAIVFDL